ncbi:MAG TPA: Rieske 2Fe-2S domain-containing protein [Stellaceae bacterium]|nr:Rieske 2Fe-2S domain-containing protein [Stellaceae bacterium]
MKPSKYSDFAHIGPGTLAGRFLRHFWQPIYIGSELAPGRPVRVQLLGEYFTLYRGDSGAPFVLEDRCPHRQTSLALGSVEGDCIRCFYHGWKFDGAGACQEQPAEKAGFAAKVQARAYPTREYLGLIFAYFGEGEAPALPRFPEMEEAEGVLVASRHPVPCNYFQRIENDLDETHVHFVHRVSTDSYGLSELPEIDVTETDYGILRIGARSGGGANATRTAHWMMPNVHFLDLPPSPDHPHWTVYLAFRVPVDDENMLTLSVAVRPAGGNSGPRKKLEPDPLQLTADILAGKLRIQDIDPAYPGLFVVQDNVALAGQGRIVDRSRDRLGQSDKGIILLRQLWERELKKLAEGKPIKAWRRPRGKLHLLVDRPKELAEI